VRQPGKAGQHRHNRLAVDVKRLFDGGLVLPFPAKGDCARRPCQILDEDPDRLNTVSLPRLRPEHLERVARQLLEGLFAAVEEVIDEMAHEPVDAVFIRIHVQRWVHSQWNQPEIALCVADSGDGPGVPGVGYAIERKHHLEYLVPFDTKERGVLWTQQKVDVCRKLFLALQIVVHVLQKYSVDQHRFCGHYEPRGALPQPRGAVHDECLRLVCVAVANKGRLGIFGLGAQLLDDVDESTFEADDSVRVGCARHLLERSPPQRSNRLLLSSCEYTER